MKAANRHTLCWLIVVVAVLAGSATAQASTTTMRPPMKNVRLDDWPERVESARSWAKVMYGAHVFRPRLIVEHWTESHRQEDAIGYFNTSPDAAWVHFVIDTDGTITQLAPLDVLAKHALGVSPWAIGIEHVGVSDREVMRNVAMRRASYQLTCWLREKLRIPIRGVIGHGEVPFNPRFGFTKAGWKWITETGYQFHRDFSHRTMQSYRARLAKRCF